MKPWEGGVSQGVEIARTMNQMCDYFLLDKRRSQTKVTEIGHIWRARPQQTLEGKLGRM